MANQNAPLDETDFLNLLHCARQGNETALGSLLENHRKYLLLIANQEMDQDIAGKLGASDVVQESMLTAYKCFGQFVGETKPQLLAWLRTIVVNDLHRAHRTYRSTQKRKISRERPLQFDSSWENPLVDPQNTPQSNALFMEQSARLNWAMSQLPEDYQRVIELRSFQCKSFEEIGETMSRSADAIRKLWTRAILKLQEMIAKKNN